MKIAPAGLLKKIKLEQIKNKAIEALDKGTAFIKVAPKKIKTLTHDTVEFVKHNPKQAGIYALAGLGALAILNGVKEITKAGVEKIQDRRYS